MKKIFLFLSLVTIIFVLFNSAMKGHDCKIHCLEEDYTSGTTPFQYNGCWLLAHWKYRYLNCEGMKIPICEYTLESITYISGTKPCWVATDAYDVSQEAMKKILETDAQNSACAQNLQNGQCSSEFAWTWKSCWKWVFDDPNAPTHPTSLEHCWWIKNECCKSVWKVCKINGVFVPTKLADLGLNPLCPYEKEDPPELKCFGICEDLPPPASPSNIEENVNHESGFTTFVFPNPSSDIINIRLISKTDGEHQIEVFDISGNLILTQSLSKHQNEELIQLKMGNYANGTYNYVIKHNGVPGINGSFKLLK